MMENMLPGIEDKYAYKTRNFDKMNWAIAHLDQKLKDPKNVWDPRDDHWTNWDPQSSYDRLNLKNLRDENTGMDLEKYISDDLGSA